MNKPIQSNSNATPISEEDFSSSTTQGGKILVQKAWRDTVFEIFFDIDQGKFVKPSQITEATFPWGYKYYIVDYMLDDWYYYLITGHILNEKDNEHIRTTYGNDAFEKIKDRLEDVMEFIVAMVKVKGLDEDEEPVIEDWHETAYWLVPTNPAKRTIEILKDIKNENMMVTVNYDKEYDKAEIDYLLQGGIDPGIWGVEITQENEKKIIRKRYEDGKLELEIDEHGHVDRMKAETNHIEVEANAKEGYDETKITKYYNDGSVQSFVHTFMPGNANYEDPWYILDVDYYNDYFKEKSIMPLIIHILKNIRDNVQNVLNYYGEQE